MVKSCLNSMFIEYSKLVYFTDTDILERLATVNKPYKVDVKVYKTTRSWLHFTYSVIAELWRAKRACGAPWVRKCGNLPIRENLVIT